MDTESLPVFDLGVAPYLPVQALQARLRTAVAQGAIRGMILLLEHSPVITLGRRGTSEDLLDLALAEARGVEVTSSERGGQTTLHAPGQLVTYAVIPIPRRDLRAYVESLEQTLVVLLVGWGLDAYRRDGRPGLYIDGKKIASVGLRCQHWVASHGTSLNGSVDLSLFDLITSCGEPGLRQTSIQELTGTPPAMDELKQSYVRAFAEVFKVSLGAPVAVPFHQVETLLRICSPGLGQ